MTPFLQPLHEEHQELLPHIEQMKTVADAVGNTPLAALRQEIDAITAFLVRQLLPHAQAEERALYPFVEEVMGAKGATATMSQDHVAIGRLAKELSDLCPRLQGERLEAWQEQALRRMLYGLFALVTVHFAKEEEIYLPLLEQHLTEDSARSLFETMEQAAREAKQAMTGAR